MVTWCCEKMQLQCIDQRAATLAASILSFPASLFSSLSFLLANTGCHKTGREAKYTAHPAELPDLTVCVCSLCMCVAVTVSTSLPPPLLSSSSILPASSLALHQGWWENVYGKWRESSLSAYKISLHFSILHLFFFAGAVHHYRLYRGFIRQRGIHATLFSRGHKHVMRGIQAMTTSIPCRFRACATTRTERCRTVSVWTLQTKTTSQPKSCT